MLTVAHLHKRCNHRPIIRKTSDRNTRIVYTAGSADPPTPPTQSRLGGAGVRPPPWWVGRFGQRGHETSVTTVVSTPTRQCNGIGAYVRQNRRHVTPINQYRGKTKAMRSVAEIALGTCAPRLVDEATFSFHRI